MEVSLLPLDEVDKRLHNLRDLLQNLPPTVPTSSVWYNFQKYTPDPEKVDRYGSEESAVNQALEVILCPGGRGSLIRFKERGPGLVAVVDVLKKYIHAFPNSEMLQKWIFDLTEAAVASVSSDTSYTLLHR